MNQTEELIVRVLSLLSRAENSCSESDGDEIRKEALIAALHGPPNAATVALVHIARLAQ